MQGTKNYNRNLSKLSHKSKQLRTAQQRIRELTKSRDNWKQKYKTLKSQHTSLQKQQSKRSTINSSQVTCIPRMFKTDIPKHHSFPTQVIMLCIWIRQQGNCSLVTCVQVLRIMSMIFHLSLRIPSKNSIHNWEKKLGHYRVHLPPVEQSRWAVIMDESISIGAQKLLLILGVNLPTYSFGGALTFQDVQVLDLSVGTCWTSDLIQKRLRGLQDRGYLLEYGLSDGGKNLVKAFELCGLDWISDCSHAFGNMLKRHYQKEAIFEAFTSQSNRFRQQVSISNAAILMPPKQRQKGRFLNLFPLSDWGYKMLRLLQDNDSGLTQEQREKLAWLTHYQDFIIELHRNTSTINRLSKLLKTQGLGLETHQECQKILANQMSSTWLQQQVHDYLEENLSKIGIHSRLLCCSDVIESIFGKYKNQVGKLADPIITDACLGIANLSQNFQLEEIKNAMEQTRMVDLIEWKQNNLPENSLKKRKKLLKSAA